ncbi:hypothetical protein [Tardiphaga sp. OK245]|uniref:hypothetical protein n=1 Tax=Tardiphaga sp. OK245 TaxID=1855306 RepID=UPI001114E2E7|nr:hypothetical protein [Tardiphaga sp. OK245]
MNVDDLRRLLKNFAADARLSKIGTSPTRNRSLADLAEQLEKQLGSAEVLKEVRGSDTISFNPGRCPTCGK